MTKTVNTPVVKNTKVATIDRIENLLIPQMPCPLVQPLPIFVPIPTKKPPRIITGIEVVMLNGIIDFVKTE